jgi:hypothetical protein
MRIPITGLKYHSYEQPIVGEIIYLVKEPDNPIDSMAVAAFNDLNQRMGYVSSKYNQKVFSGMSDEKCLAKVWWVFRTYILIDVETF